MPKSTTRTVVEIVPGTIGELRSALDFLTEAGIPDTAKVETPGLMGHWLTVTAIAVTHTLPIESDGDA